MTRLAVDADTDAALNLLTNGWFHFEDKIDCESSKNLRIYIPTTKLRGLDSASV